MTPTKGRQIRVASTSEVPDGGRLIVEVEKRRIGIFHVDGEYFAFLHRCPHLGGPLCDGPVLGLMEADRPGEIRYDPTRRFLTCPWHGWEFDLRTGRSYVDPARVRARTFPVDVTWDRTADEPPTNDSSVRDEEIGRRVGRYVAESYPTAVVDGHILITLRAAQDGASDRRAQAGPEAQT